MAEPVIAQRSDLPQRTEAEQAAFFATVRDRALLAEAQAGAIEHWFDIAGLIVRIVFAGPALADAFVAALAHLHTVPVPDPVATLHVWDSTSTGVDIPPPPCHRDCFTDRGDIWGFASERFRSAFHWVEFSLVLMDTETSEGVYWVRDVAGLPYWAKASPLRTLFHWVTERSGRQLLHAAAVGDSNGAVLITGKGGAGKSTIAIACLDAGMRYLGDDYVVVGLLPEPCVYSLYNTAKLNPDRLAAFPSLAKLAADYAADEKAVLSLYPAHADSIARALPLRAVLTPEIVEQPETSFAAIDTTALARAAAFTTLSQLPHAGQQTHAVIDQLLDAVPGLRIRSGSAMERIPGAVRRLLEHGATEVERNANDVRHRPLVSVIIPVFNGAHFLPECIDSVLRQNYPALEIIVVDDGSTDAIEAAVAALPIDVRFFRQPNNGPAAARNRGIKDASGELIAFLDVDDLWTDNNLNTLADALAEDATRDVVLGYGQLVRPNPATGKLDYIGNPNESFPWYIGAALYRRDVFHRVGLFDVTMRFGEDTDWYNRARECGVAMAVVPQVALLVRRHGANMTYGRSMLELSTLRVFKKALDRRRVAPKGT